MATNPFYVEPMSLQGLGAIGQAYFKKQAQEEQALANQALEQEALTALETNDPAEMSRFMVANPQFAQGIQQAYGFRSDQTKQNAIDSSLRILQGEDPDEVLRDRAAFVSQQGGDPSGTLSVIGDPERAKKLATMTLAANLPPQQIKAMQSAGIIPEVGKAITPYQQEQLDIKRQTLEIRKEENETRKLEQALAKETNELKRDELKLKIKDRKAKIDQAKQDIQSGLESELSTIDNTLATIDQLKQGEGLEAAVGTTSLLPTLPGSAAADFEERLEQLKSQQFLNEVGRLKGMGALSENEGKKLAAAASALSLRMSEEAFKEELDYIESTMNKARAKVSGKLPKSEDPKAEQVQYTEGQTATNPQTGQTLIFRGGQWLPQ